MKVINRTTIEIDCRDDCNCDAPFDMIADSCIILLIGAIARAVLARQNTMPGGCNFGVRPIDQHIKGADAMGAEMKCETVLCSPRQRAAAFRRRVYLEDLRRREINYHDRGDHGKRRTVIENAAREPHIVDLAKLFNSWGRTSEAPETRYDQGERC